MYRIKEISKKQRITLKEVAENINVAPNTLSRIINGENTTVDMLQKIANTLKVPIHQLFDNTSETIHLIIKDELITFRNLEELKKFVSDY